MNSNLPHLGAQGPLVFCANLAAHQLATEAGFASVWIADLLRDGRTSLPLGIIEQIESARRCGQRLVALSFHQGDPGLNQVFELFRGSNLDPRWLELVIFRSEKIYAFVMSELERAVNGWPVGRGPGGIQTDTRVTRHDHQIFRLACEIEAMKTGRTLPEGIHRLGDVLEEVRVAK